VSYFSTYYSLAPIQTTLRTQLLGIPSIIINLFYNARHLFKFYFVYLSLNEELCISVRFSTVANHNVNLTCM